jgi:uncharacterized Tic20 family protein
MSTEQRVTGNQQTWRVVAHASAFIQFAGIPSVIGPLIVWLLRRDDPVVAPHARAALNFQLTLLIYFAAGAVLALLAAITIVGLVITGVIVLLMLVLVFLELLFALLGTLAASRGELYDYPMSLELVKG